MTYLTLWSLTKNNYITSSPMLIFDMKWVSLSPRLFIVTYHFSRQTSFKIPHSCISRFRGSTNDISVPCPNLNPTSRHSMSAQSMVKSSLLSRHLITHFLSTFVAILGCSKYFGTSSEKCSSTSYLDVPSKYLSLQQTDFFQGTAFPSFTGRRTTSQYHLQT